MKTGYVIAAFLGCAFAVPFLFRGPPAPPPTTAETVTTTATIAPLKFDQLTADQNMRLDQGDAGLAFCFDRAIRGMLRMGLRDRTPIIQFATTTCGPGFKRQLILAGSSNAAATAYIELAAADHLDAILRDGAPHQ